MSCLGQVVSVLQKQGSQSRDPLSSGFSFNLNRFFFFDYSSNIDIMIKKGGRHLTVPRTVNLLGNIVNAQVNPNCLSTD